MVSRKMFLCICASLFCGYHSSSYADTATFDFNSGIGPYFSSFYINGLFNVATEGPQIRISKPFDDGSVATTTSVAAGIYSNFYVSGDFTITVDFTLTDFPLPNQSEGLNESWLQVVSLDYQSQASILRYTHPTEGNLIMGWTDPAPNHIGVSQSSSLMSGRYQLQRSGSTIAVSFADPGSSLFTELGSVDGIPDPMRIQLYAAQTHAVENYPRSTTSLDISFDNLIVVADQIQGIPEPSTFVLLGIGALGLMAYTWRRRK